MKIITNLLKDTRDEWLVRTTATMNTSNAIVDRIMDDDSVEGVIMTNREAIPPLTAAAVFVQCRERYHANIRQNKHFASININTKCLPPGAPILTNVSVTGATNNARALHKFGMLSQMYVKELNPLEEIMIIRLHTKKNVIMVAPDSEFSIVVIQHARARRKVIKGKEK